MSRRLIRSSEHRVMPWKNGGGSTAEIAVAPARADLASGFDWRLSIATVAKDGPFSTFAGYDRTIMLIEGAGMVLDFGADRRERIERRFDPFHFAGEEPVECRLVAGPIRDFNLILRRASHAAEVHVVELAEEPLALATDGGSMLVHCLAGAATLDKQALGSGDTVLIEAETGLLGELAGTPAATLFVAAIFPRS